MTNFTCLKQFGTLISLVLIGSGIICADNSVAVKSLGNIKVQTTENLSTRADEDLPNAPIITNPITEVVGVEVNFVRYGAGYYPSQGMVYYYDEDTEPSPSSIVFGVDNKIYFKDLMDFGWDTFIEGTREGNKITVKLPQTIFKEEYDWAEEPYYQNLCVMTQRGQGESLGFSYDPYITEVTYTIDDKNNISLDPLPEGKALGITTYFIGKIYETPEDEEAENDNYHTGWVSAWSGAADFAQNFYPLGKELISWPENLKPVQYQVLTNGYNYPVNIGFQDNYMYIQGLGDSKYINDFVIRADVKDNIVSIPQNQYIGVYSYDNQWIVTKCGYEVDDQIVISEDNVTFDFNYDPVAHTLTPVDENQRLVLAYLMLLDPDTNQNGILYYLNYFYMVYQESFPGTPQTPKITGYDTSDYATYGYNSIVFEMSTTSTEGGILLSGDLYYSIYIDGDIITFEYEQGTELGEYSKYFRLPEPTDEVPFLFDNENEFWTWDEVTRSVGFYYDGVTTVGVQAIYYWDGVKTVSDIATLNLDTMTVTNIPAAVKTIPVSGDVISTEYFDLSGRKIVNPQNGIFVKKDTLDNGQIATQKVAFK